MTAPAAALRCPNCGAPAAPGAVRCEYCRTALATVSCPNCFELLFDGTAFCPHCGAARSRADTAQPTALKCPACRAAMRWVTVGAVDLLECTECDGTWIEAAAFERLCAERDRQSAVLARPASDRPAAAPPTAPLRYRPCPRCGKLMNRVNFGRISGTVIDVCRGHGTYLDRGELHQVVEFILDGGLDRTRQIEKDALVEEERRLREAEAGGAQAWNDRSVRELLAAVLGRRE